MDQPSRDPRSSCSSAWNALSAWGTATRAGFWVALEQPGPWGRDALTQSHLDRALGARLNASSAGAGGRVLLIRAPGAHSDRTGTAKRRVFVAGALAGRPWLLSGHVEDPAELEALPWHALSTGSADAVLASLPWLRPTGEPVLLLCTNSKRDVCSALKVRPVAHAVALQLPGQLWECSHTGGHRFAPTGIVLPVGQMLARLTPELASHVLDAAASGQLAVGTLDERHDRGLSHLAPPEQAAASWVRAHEGVTDPAALTVVDGTHSVTVHHVDGRTWELVTEQRQGEDLPESCGRPAKPSVTWTVRPAP